MIPSRTNQDSAFNSGDPTNRIEKMAIDSPRSLDQDLIGEIIIPARATLLGVGKLNLDCPAASVSQPIDIILEAELTKNNWMHVMSTRITGTGSATLDRPKFDVDLPFWALRYRYRIITSVSQRVLAGER